MAEHFSKLKLTFLHLEAKAKFLSWMARDEAVPIVSPADVDEAEANIRSGKQLVADLTRDIDEQKAAILSLISDLTSLWAHIDRDAAAMAGQWDDGEWAELRALMADLGEADPVPLCTQHHLDALLAHHRSLHSPLSSSLAATLAEESAISHEIDTVEAEAVRLEAEEAAIQALLTRHANVPDHVEWYEAGLDTLARLTGVRVDRKEGNDRSLLVTIEGAEGRTAEVEVDCVPGSLDFNGARLVRGGRGRAAVGRRVGLRDGHAGLGLYGTRGAGAHVVGHTQPTPAVRLSAALALLTELAPAG